MQALQSVMGGGRNGGVSNPQFQHVTPCAHHPLPVPGPHPSWRMSARERCHDLDPVQVSQHTGEKDEPQRQGDFRRSLNSRRQRQGQPLSFLSSTLGARAPNSCVPTSLIPVTLSFRFPPGWRRKINKIQELAKNRL